MQHYYDTMYCLSNRLNRCVVTLPLFWILTFTFYYSTCLDSVFSKVEENGFQWNYAIYNTCWLIADVSLGFVSCQACSQVEKSYEQ